MKAREIKEIKILDGINYFDASKFRQKYGKKNVIKYYLECLRWWIRDYDSFPIGKEGGKAA